MKATLRKTIPVTAAVIMLVASFATLGVTLPRTPLDFYSFAGLASGQYSSVSIFGVTATVTTDKSDYSPGSTVNISGSGFGASEQIKLQVTHSDGTPEGGGGHDPWYVMAGPDGSFTATWYVNPDDSLNSTFLLTADGMSTGAHAETTFTDTSIGTYDQCSNDLGTGYTTGDTGCRWINGNLQSSNSTYFEGDSTVQRLWLDGLVPGSTHTVTLKYGTTKSGKHAYDFLTTWNWSENWITSADLCQDITGCTGAFGTADTFDIPGDPNVPDVGTPNGIEPVAPGARQFVLAGGDLTASTVPTIVSGDYSGDSETAITITFNVGPNSGAMCTTKQGVTTCGVALWFGAHISKGSEWRKIDGRSGAVSIPGSPYHVALDKLDGAAVGQRDNQMQANAVIAPATITIVKDATPNGSTSFGFTASPSPLTNFSLVDDGTTANTKTFSNILNFTTYTITESNIPSGWGFDSATCSVDPGSANGGSANAGLTSTIDVREGEAWTCTYYDSLRTGTLTVIKHVINDNGGTATAGQWSLHVKNGANEVNGSPQAGSESGTSYTLNGGTYTVSETGGPSGYTFDGFSGDCDSSGNVTVVAGQNKTCTLTNNDQPAHITVTKVVNNTHGGTAKPNDFLLTLGGNAVTSGVSVAVNAGTYTAAETLLAGYAFDGFTGDCNSSGSVTVGVGQSKTCTLTNHDLAPNLTISKTADQGTVNAGDPIGFTITVGNNGQAQANGVTLTDTLPTNGGLTWSIDAAGSDTGCSIAGGVLTCNFGNLAAGSSKHVHITSPTTAASCGTVSNTASASASNNDAVQASASVTVNCPDITVQKTAVTGTINAGDTAAFNIVVSNIGQGTAKNVTLSDTLPAGISWSVSGPDAAACSITGNTLSCSFGNIAAGGSKTIQVSGTTTPAQCGQLNNTATVAATNESNTSNNSSSASITVNCPDVTVTKQAVTGTINAGDTAAFKIVLSNIGTGTAYNVTLNDPLPAGITWSINPAVTGCSISGGILSCSFASLAAGASVEINVSGTTSAANCGVLSNTATVAASNESNTTNNSASANITVNCADVTVSKQAVTGTINAGDTAAFKIVVSNIGAGTAYNVTVNDPLPSGVTWAINPAVTGCSISGGTLSCSFASLAAGASVEIDVSGTTTAANCGTLPNTVTVSASNESNTGNNSAMASITVQCPNISVLKTADQGTVSAGDAIGFTITVSNAGPGSASSVTLTDTLPTTAGLAWAIDAAGSDTGCSIAGGVLTCNFGTLAANTSKHVHITSPTTTATCGTVNNTATATASNEPSGSGGDNTSSASVTVNCPNLQVVKTADAGTVNAGDPIGFTLTVTNTGTGTARNVVLTDTLPGGAGILFSISPAVQGCSILNAVLTCNFGDLAPQGSASVHITSPTTAASCLQLANVGFAVGNNAPQVQGSASITVQCPDVQVTKVGDQGTVDAGTTIGFTMVVKNNGPGTALGVTLTDTLPAGGALTWTVDGGTGSSFCSISSGMLTCTFGTMASQAQYSVHVSSPTSAANCGTVNNTANVTAANEVANSNNTSSASVNVRCGTIIIKKISDPPNTGSFGFTTGGTGYQPFTIGGGQQNSQTLQPGSYSATEGTQLGWILTGIGGSTDTNTPYACTVSGSGGSSGLGDLTTGTVSITLKGGDTVTCVFENSSMNITRTQGFWATHPNLAIIAWNGGTNFGHTFPGVAATAGIGDTTLCGRTITLNDLNLPSGAGQSSLMGGFWSDISKTTTNSKRSALDQARMQLLQQLLAAELNASAFGSVPASGSFALWESAYCGSNQNAIKNAQQQAASFNTLGDSGQFTPGTSANSKLARALADYKFWDILP